MDSLAYILITHTSYADVLDVYLQENKKHFPCIPLTIAINDASILNRYDGQGLFDRVIIYDDTLLYGARMKYILEQVNAEFVLLNHDSNVIVGPPNIDVLQGVLQFMQTNHVDQMRLSDAGILSPKRNHKWWHKNRGNYFMSALTAIWRRTSALNLYTIFQNHSMRCIECEPIQEYTKKLKNYYISSPNDLYQMPHMHSIPEYFPTVHVTHLGKWTTHAHGNRKYILKLSQEYNINLHQRGCM